MIPPEIKAIQDRQRNIDRSISAGLFFAVAVSVVLYIYFGDPFQNPAPFIYLGDRNSHGVVEYTPVNDQLCIGDNLEYEISVKVVRPYGHVDLRTKFAHRPSGGNVSGYITDDRMLFLPAEYHGSARSVEISELSAGDYWLGNAAYTENTQSDMYVVPFTVLEPIICAAMNR